MHTAHYATRNNALRVSRCVFAEQAIVQAVVSVRPQRPYPGVTAVWGRVVTSLRQFLTMRSAPPPATAGHLRTLLEDHLKMQQRLPLIAVRPPGPEPHSLAIKARGFPFDLEVGLPEPLQSKLPGFFFSVEQFVEESYKRFYASGKMLFGRDYDTAPGKLRPFFGWLMARQVKRMWSGMIEAGTIRPDERFDIMELAPGKGDLAISALEDIVRQMSAETAEQSAQPDSWTRFYRQLRWHAADISPTAVAAFREEAGRQPPAIGDKLNIANGDALEFLKAMGRGRKGVVLSNEYFDNVPAHQLRSGEGGRIEAAYLMPTLPQPLLDELCDNGLLDRGTLRTLAVADYANVGISRDDYRRLLDRIEEPANRSWKDRLRGQIKMAVHYVDARTVPDLARYMEIHKGALERKLRAARGPVTWFACPRHDDLMEAVSNVLDKGYVLTTDYILDTGYIFDEGMPLLKFYHDPGRPVDWRSDLADYDTTFTHDAGFVMESGRRHRIRPLYFGPQSMLEQDAHFTMDSEEFDRFMLRRFRDEAVAKIRPGSVPQDIAHYFTNPQAAADRVVLMLNQILFEPEALTAALAAAASRNPRLGAVLSIVANYAAQIADVLRNNVERERLFFYNTQFHVLVQQVEGTDPKYQFARSDSLSDRHGKVDVYRRIMMPLLEGFIPSQILSDMPAGGRALDIGAGRGAFRRIFHKAWPRAMSFYEVDPVVDDLAYPRRYEVPRVAAQLPDLPFPAESFKAVLVLSLLDLLTPELLQASLEEIHRVMEEDGVLVVMSAQAPVGLVRAAAERAGQIPFLYTGVNESGIAGAKLLYLVREKLEELIRLNPTNLPPLMIEYLERFAEDPEHWVNLTAEITPQILNVFKAFFEAMPGLVAEKDIPVVDAVFEQVRQAVSATFGGRGFDVIYADTIEAAMEVYRNMEWGLPDAHNVVSLTGGFAGSFADPAVPEDSARLETSLKLLIARKRAARAGMPAGPEEAGAMASGTIRLKSRWIPYGWRDSIEGDFQAWDSGEGPVPFKINYNIPSGPEPAKDAIIGLIRHEWEADKPLERAGPGLEALINQALIWYGQRFKGVTAVLDYHNDVKGIGHPDFIGVGGRFQGNAAAWLHEILHAYFAVPEHAGMIESFHADILSAPARDWLSAHLRKPGRRQTMADCIIRAITKDALPWSDDQLTLLIRADLPYRASSAALIQLPPAEPVDIRTALTPREQKLIWVLDYVSRTLNLAAIDYLANGRSLESMIHAKASPELTPLSLGMLSTVVHAIEKDSGNFFSLLGEFIGMAGLDSLVRHEFLTGPRSVLNGVTAKLPSLRKLVDRLSPPEASPLKAASIEMTNKGCDIHAAGTVYIEAGDRTYSFFVRSETSGRRVVHTAWLTWQGLPEPYQIELHRQVTRVGKRFSTINDDKNQTLASPHFGISNIVVGEGRDIRMRIVDLSGKVTRVRYEEPGGGFESTSKSIWMAPGLVVSFLAEIAHQPQLHGWGALLLVAGLLITAVAWVESEKNTVAPAPHPVERGGGTGSPRTQGAPAPHPFENSKRPLFSVNTDPAIPHTGYMRRDLSPKLQAILSFHRRTEQQDTLFGQHLQRVVDKLNRILQPAMQAVFRKDPRYPFVCQVASIIAADELPKKMSRKVQINFWGGRFRWSGRGDVHLFLIVVDPEGDRYYASFTDGQYALSPEGMMVHDPAFMAWYRGNGLDFCNLKRIPTGISTKDYLEQSLGFLDAIPWTETEMDDVRHSLAQQVIDTKRLMKSISMSQGTDIVKSAHGDTALPGIRIKALEPAGPAPHPVNSGGGTGSPGTQGAPADWKTRRAA